MHRTLVAAALLLMSLTAHAERVTDYVNPFIGTSNFGACNPGAVVPNGLMSVSPFNVMGSDLNVWDKDSRWWSTPYVEENRWFTGFSHVNLSGVGCPDLGSVLTMPVTGSLQVDYRLYGSEYTAETARPGYYALTLLNGGIVAEATATLRSSIERYTYPDGGEAHVLVNLGHGLTNETGASVRKVSDTEIEGMKLMGTFCYNPQKVFPMYFVIRVSKAPSSTGFWKKQRQLKAQAAWDSFSGKYKVYTEYSREMAGDDIGYIFSYDSLEAGEQILVQVGVSFVSTENARQNLDEEQQGFDFEKVRASAETLWERDLSRIRISGGSDERKTVFYTALYHTLLHPNILEDVNGEYPLMETGGTGRVEKGRHRYTVFSLWDTYRNVHQLMTLLFPERQTDMVRSTIDMYREWGWMPKWELFGRETFTMEGDPIIPMITDTWLKGLRDFDIETAYEAFIKSAGTAGAHNAMRPDNDPYKELGYIPLGYFSADFSGDNSVSHALEYYVADNALSLLAEALGHKEDAALYRQRSLGYRHYYSKESGTLRPIDKDGRFLTPFDPRQGENFEPVPGFHEGSAWNYTFYVPHDVEAYARLMGGTKAFNTKLRRVFDEGLFDPANEPDIAYPYLFSRFRGYEKYTWHYVSDILDKHFTTAPDGIPGNDDTGTMSAWAVFSMLGFYPDCPGEPYYTLTMPSFDKAEITLGDGSVLTVTRGDGASRATIGGRTVKNYRIPHTTLVNTKYINWK
ncbi:MAG: GH92 family glycosyl hydrolase [Bacteroidales bacterium]|nr:GH92 family glycosyl hydrolase [Bacteroidales bacterium]